MNSIPDLRIRSINDAEPNTDGDYVLYWMIANRRVRSNFSLQRAVEWAEELNKPLLILEALRAGYQWASDRIHYFVIQGMADNARALAKKPVTYYPWLEENLGDGRGLLKALGKRAAVVVSDDFPCFFLPRMIDSAASQVKVRFELVDSNGLLPMRAADKIYARAYDFRRFLQKNLLPHLNDWPNDDPLSRKKLPKLDKLPADVLKKWPAADVESLAADSRRMSEFPIDHNVGTSMIAGGSGAANKRLKSFMAGTIDQYGDLRNHPTEEVTTGLSPHLHFGHISGQQIFKAVIDREDWSVDKVAEKAKGSARGWWGMSECAESFVDQIVTWRELGYNMCWQLPNYDQYETLPDWAKRTMREHEKDRREYLYSLEEFETSKTHDGLWNAAQRQLVREGRIHNYLRMLWGKKIYEWTANGREALEVMIELNNKYALDGRNPNSYSGIFWILGRYDRAWGPERKIFGKIRYMSSDNTARKVKVKPYLAKYSAQGALF